VAIDKNPPPQAIRAQLARILQSADFKASDKQRQFLSFVVEETLQGRASQIKGYTIAVAVYGRAETFDPQVDPIVRVEAGRLRRAMEYYYLAAGSNDPLRIVIPKGTYIPVFNSAEAPLPEFKTHIKKSAVNRASGKPSIAVLPLTNLTDDGAQNYFSNGLTEEITVEIARYQDIRVIAAQSTMRFKGQKVDPENIGRDLGVRYLLTGSVRNDLNSIKIIIGLIDTPMSQQIWGKTHTIDKNAQNLIKIQEKIAYSVSGIIADQYGIIARRLSKESRKKVPANLKAYDAVLQFYQYETVLTPESFDTALAALEQAIQIDPDYGLAYAMIGHLHADNYALGFREIDAPLEKALMYAHKAIALEPQNQFVHDALALVYFHQGTKSAFMQSAEEAIALNPNAPYIIGVAGWHMIMFGEWDRGLALLEKGMKRNPYYPTWFHLATFIFHYRDAEYEKAYAEALKFNFPTLFWDPLIRAAALGQMGRFDEAESAVKQLLKIEKDFETRGRALIIHYVKVDKIVDKIVEGLHKAGMAGIE
jgi:adenylate cyclase